MRGDLHVGFGKGRLRVILAAYFHHYTPNIELAFNSVEYIMRDGAGCSVLFCFICLTSFAVVLKTMFRKPSTSRKRVYYGDHLVLHKPLAISEYRLRLREMSLNCLKPAIADLCSIFWLCLRFIQQILYSGNRWIRLSCAK